MKETKAERFKRVATVRVNKMIKLMQLIGNCSNTATYEFTEKEANRMFDAMQVELDKARARFEEANSSRLHFSFDCEESEQNDIV